MSEPVSRYDRRQLPRDLPRPAARFRRRPARAASQELGVATLFWFTVFIAGGVALGCIGFGMSSPQADAIAENSLRDDPPIPKLINVPTEEPAPAVAAASVEPPPSAPAPPDRHTAEPSRIVMIPALDLPRIVTEPPALLPVGATAAVLAEANSDPTVYLPSREPTSGESPMIRTWKTLAAAALLAAATPPLATAGGTAQPDNKEVLRKVDELRSTVEALSKKVDGMAGTANKEVLADLKRIEKAVLEQIEKINRDLKVDVAGIREDQFKQKLELQGLNSKLKAFDEQMVELSERLLKLRKQVATDVPPITVPGPPLDKSAIEDIRYRMGAIEKALAAMQPPLGTKDRTSLSPPVPSNFGRVLLTNLYNQSMLFTVNDQRIRVEPNETRELRDVPPGPITYEVFADGWGVIRTRKTTSLLPNETLTIVAK